MFRLIGSLWLKFFGWELNGQAPEEKHYVLIAYPHTSNWDYTFMLASGWVYGVKLNWLGKAELFRNPVAGWLFRKTGGIAVDRSSAGNVVDQVVDLFRTREDFMLVVPVSGTRSHRPYWKSGFYHIALGADVPVNLAVMDFVKKRVGFGPMIRLTGDVTADMDKIRDYYKDVRGKNHENASTILLRSEVADETENAPVERAIASVE